MPVHSNYVSALHVYDSAINDLTARVQQDRVLHMHDLTSAYMQAVASGMSKKYLSMLESTIGERSIYNDRKLVFDAADLSVQEKKLSRALGSNAGALSGGAVVDNSRNALKGMHYSAQRSNALYSSFNQKLAHDRAVHAIELRTLLGATPSNSVVAKVLTDLVNMRTHNNYLRTMHDAREWANVDAQVGQLLGGGRNAEDVVNHGVTQTLSGKRSNTRITNSGLVDIGNFRFGSDAAARLWQDVVN